MPKSELPKPDTGQKPWIRRLLFVLASLAILFLEHLALDALGLRQHEVSFMAQFYQPIVYGEFPKLTPTITTVLEVDSPAAQAGPGAVRQALALLIPRILRELKPRVIVLNAAFQDLRSRPADAYDRVTSDLVVQVHFVCDSGTAVVSGFNVQAGRILPHVRLGPNCDEGYLNAQNALNDFRRVPMPIEIDGRNYPSLSYAAAWAYRHSVSEAVRVQRSELTGESLYCPLFRVGDYSGRSVLASSFLEGSVSGKVRSKIRDSVLIVGFTNEQPVKTPAGLLPGRYLQAAYIEAFNSGWLIREVPHWVNLLLAVMFFGFVTWPRGISVQLLRIAIGISCLFAINFVLIHGWGLYSDCGLISVAGVTVWVMRHLQQYYVAKYLGT